MTLKRNIIIALAEILAGMKINKVVNKEAKAALLKDYLALRKEAKQADADREEIVRKFQDDWAEELPKVESFRRQGKPVVGHLDYLEAEKDANKAISDIFSQEVDIDLTAVPIDALDAVSEDITLEQIALLQENGIIE